MWCVENFRPGVMARLGLGYAQAQALKPDIVYCSVSGYGQSGPLRDWPAIDNIVQATSGMMSLGGDPGDPPMRVGFPVVDTLTGQTAAFAILAALLKRQRSGQGEYIDVAMMDASLAFMASAVVPFLVTGQPMERTGNTGYSGQPTAALFEAADGNLISLGVVQQSQFESLARLLGHEEWLDRSAFRYAGSSPRQHLELHAPCCPPCCGSARPRFGKQLLSSAGVPCGMVRDVAQASALPHLEQRGIKIPLKVPGLPAGDDVAILNAGFLFDSDGPPSAIRRRRRASTPRNCCAGSGSMPGNALRFCSTHRTSPGDHMHPRAFQSVCLASLCVLCGTGQHRCARPTRRQKNRLSASTKVIRPPSIPIRSRPPFTCRCAMASGLAVDLYRPAAGNQAAEGRFPVVWHHTLDRRAVSQPGGQCRLCHSGIDEVRLCRRARGAPRTRRIVRRSARLQRSHRGAGCVRDQRVAGAPVLVRRQGWHHRLLEYRGGCHACHHRTAAASAGGVRRLFCLGHLRLDAARRHIRAVGHRGSAHRRGGFEIQTGGRRRSRKCCCCKRRRNTK